MTIEVEQKLVIYLTFEFEADFRYFPLKQWTSFLNVHDVKQAVRTGLLRVLFLLVEKQFRTYR